MDEHEQTPTRRDGDATSLGAYLLDHAAGPDPATDPDPAADPERATDAERKPQRRLRTGRIVLGATLAVLSCLALVFGPTTLQLLRERNARIDLPPRIARFALDQGQGARDTVDYLRAAISAGVPLDKTVGAVYVEDEDTAHSVIFFGGTGLLLSPDKQLNKAFGLITDQTGGVEGVRPRAADSLGGVVMCGTTPTDDGPMAVCGWADHGSLAVALFPGRGVDESAGLLRQMRSAMQHRG
jgi:hypothetical protein